MSAQGYWEGMARNEIAVDASPEQVFAVLADPSCYPDWVVGAKAVRAADPSWPEPGALLHHKVGAGPVELRDNTKVLLCDRPRVLVLEARARPLGVAEVRIEIEGDVSGSRVVMHEYVVRPKALRVLSPLVDLAIKARNVESLRRLKELAEQRRLADR